MSVYERLLRLLGEAEDLRHKREHVKKLREVRFSRTYARFRLHIMQMQHEVDELRRLRQASLQTHVESNGDAASLSGGKPAGDIRATRDRVRD